MKRFLIAFLVVLSCCISASAVNIENQTIDTITTPYYNVSSFIARYNGVLRVDYSERSIKNPGPVTYTVTPFVDVNHIFSTAVCKGSGGDTYSYQATEAARRCIEPHVTAIQNAYPSGFVKLTSVNVTTRNLGSTASNTQVTLNYPGEKQIQFISDTFNFGKIVSFHTYCNDNSYASYYSWSNSRGTYYSPEAALRVAIGYVHTYATRYCSVGSIESLSFPLNFC